MHNCELSMKKTYLLSSFLLWSIIHCFAYADAESAQQFAERLQGIIVNGEVEKFRKLSCVPTDCVDEADVRYVFGGGDQGGFVKRFLGRSGVDIRVFGPFEYSETLSGDEYILMYYDPAVVDFDAEGYLSQEDREHLWWKGYVETVVSYKDEKWNFVYTPFYHGAHLPWADDY